ncbi:MAG: SipW-dependent-type signal peptide-containing protein [Oscillospiraceae bacterium]|nr:SipW-dependent-type signal peptide-containing protein [Oscillospiraceae bacterium]
MKKKILAIVLCVAMLAIAIVGGTMAYFTDTHAQTNTFVAGNVGISLDEAKIKLDNDPESNTFGDLIADGTTRTTATQEYHLFPGMTVTKDPTITVDDGSEDAYVAAIITVTFADGTDMAVLRKNGICMEHWKDMLNAEAILEGDYIGTVPEKEHPLNGVNGMKVYGDDRYSVYQIADAANLTYTIYMFFEGAQTDGTAITPFNKMVIPETWDNADMAAVNGMEINVVAYATQTNGFKDCYTAMTTAFPEAFDFT